MTTLAIEINDAGLVVAGSEGVLASEPGYAMVEKGSIVTGAEAYGQARLKPKQVSNRYWAELSLDSSTAPVDGVRNSAELAYAQLEALWRRFRHHVEDVVLIVPSHYDGSQLGLLLGLAQECGMQVRAMVDVAAAAGHRPYPGHELIYADASLHRVSVTPLQQGDEVNALLEHGLEAIGLVSLTDLLARRLAEIFVLATRFDPFHEAGSEQLLYDRMNDWLGLLNDQEVVKIALPHGDQDISVELERDQLLGVARGFYKALVQLIAQTRQSDTRLVVLLSHRLATLPGLADELTRLDGARVVDLPVGHAAMAVLEHIHRMPAGDGQVKLLRHFAWRAGPEETPAVSAPAATPRLEKRAATHIVYRGIAYPVDSNGLLVGRAGSAGRRVIVVDDQTAGVSRAHCELSVRDGAMTLRDLSSYGTFVNERRIAGEQTLQAADVIRIGSPGAELQVVSLEQGHGTT